MKQYNQEFKDRVVHKITESGDLRAVARKHKISPSTVRRWIEKKQGVEKIGNDGRVKQLEQDLDDALLEIAILKELLKKTNQDWHRD